MEEGKKGVLGTERLGCPIGRLWEGSAIDHSRSRNKGKKAKQSEGGNKRNLSASRELLWLPWLGRALKNMSGSQFPSL